MAYQAEIKVGVRGLKRVQELQSALNKVNIKINAINKVENAKASAGQKQKLTSVEKNLKIETQAAQIQKRALAIKDNILKMDMKGVKVSQVKAKLTRAINQAEKGKFINAKRNVAVAEKELQILRSQTVERAKQAKATGKNTFQFPMGKSSPLRFSDQGQLLPGSSRRFDLGSAAISGGFPLLFGQGPLTAAAGALGGGFGGMLGGQMGGFAGGIAATAAVQSIQNAINGIGELGKAMNRLNPNISAMSKAMGIAGTVEEKRLQLIEQNLGKQAAYNAALEMLGEKIGADKAEELRKFGETFQELGNKVTLFFTKVQAAIAKLLNQALDAGADANLRGRARDLVAQNPNNPAFRGVNRKIANIQARETTGRSGAKQKQDDLRAAKAERLEIAESLVLQKDKDKRRAETNKLITAGISDLEKENELNRAIKAGKEEEFLIQEAIKNKAEEMGLVFKDLEEGQQKRIEDAVKINRDLKEQAENAKAVRDAFESIAQSIGTDIKDGIAGLIKGTSTLGDLLNNVADKFLDMALNQALFGDILGSSGKKGGGILGFLSGGKLAKGGTAAGGKSFLVGEKGPELFVPRSTGTVVPNNKLGGGGGTNNVVVNVDASGSDVQGDDAGGQELGALIAAAVQGELVKQQRPGGILNR